MNKNFSLKKFLLILVNILLCSCSVPNSKLASVSINARLEDLVGNPVPNKKVEVTLPGSYGLNEIDIEYSEPGDVGKAEQTAIVQTDLSGTFSHTFENVTYNTAYWFFPPLGNFPKAPPKPSFVIRMLDSANAVYSIGWDDDEKLNYAIVRSNRNKDRKPPYYLTGKVIRETRGEVPACIADFKFKKSN